MLLSALLYAIALIIGLGLTLYFVGVYNQLQAYFGECTRQFSNVDVLLVQRHTELIKLVELCKQYMQHESALLRDIVLLRSRYKSSSSGNHKVAIENQINIQLSLVTAKIENYPDLKADQFFSLISSRTSVLDTDISIRRESYNSAATNYNVYIEQFPTNLIAQLFYFRTRHVFDADNFIVTEPASHYAPVKKSA